jgi:hypothetical protein
MEEDTTEAATDTLSNIPGIGPARKAALYAAGITTRTALAQASVEQLISLTGMARAQAEKALEALRETEAPSMSAPSAQVDPPLQDEAMPETPLPVLSGIEVTDAPSLLDDDQNKVTAARGMLDNAAFRARTALSDATRVWGLGEFTKPLTKFAVILDIVTEQVANVLGPKASKRLAGQLEDLSQWLEKAIIDNKPLKDKRTNKVRQRLKSKRVAIEKAVLGALRRQNAREIKAVKKATREPKRRQKRIKKQ